MERKPAVAGAFYPNEKGRLSAMIKSFLEKASPGSVSKDAISYVAPHAGYGYSGATQAFTYKALSMRPDLGGSTFVIVGPNHTGLGDPLSASEADWATPLGVVENDTELTRGIKSQSGYITLDEEAHLREHSIEVQLPFLQSVVEKPRCCFICMGDQSQEAAKILGDSINRAAGSLKRKVIVIASSDLNHYESAKTAERKDMPAIRALEELDTPKFNMLIEQAGDSACGYGPITVAASYAREHGGRRGVLLRYSNSGDTTKDYDSVVAYSSIVFV